MQRALLFEGETMQTLTHIITVAEAGATVKTIARRVLNISYTQLSKLKFAHGILLDGEAVFVDVRVCAGQMLTFLLADKENQMEPYAIPLDIAYEDDDLLIVNKPAPLPSIRSVHQSAETLENAVYAYFGCPSDYMYRPVNRLDKGTSGLMAIAKHAHAQHRMQQMLHTPQFVRKYWAVTDGIPAEHEGIIDAPIAREAEGVRRFIAPEGKPSVTHYRVLEARCSRALVELTLETGRTHQIRVHLQSIGCPVCGDYLYGQEHLLLPGRFALHSFYLCCRHPLSGMEIRCQTPMPVQFDELLNASL